MCLYIYIILFVSWNVLGYLSKLLAVYSLELGKGMTGISKTAQSPILQESPVFAAQLKALTGLKALCLNLTFALLNARGGLRLFESAYWRWGSNPTWSLEDLCEIGRSDLLSSSCFMAEALRQRRMIPRQGFPTLVSLKKTRTLRPLWLTFRNRGGCGGPISN